MFSSTKCKIYTKRMFRSKMLNLKFWKHFQFWHRYFDAAKSLSSRKFSGQLASRERTPTF